MLLKSETYGADLDVGLLNDDHVFQYCQFVGLDRLEERHLVTVDATFLSCSFEDADFYWTLFNCVVAVTCTFTRCTFRGVSFSSCRFVDCVFVDCTFTNDNLGGSCTFRETVWCGCTQSGCAGLSTEDVPVRT